jgi:hypothetical protein
VNIIDQCKQFQNELYVFLCNNVYKYRGWPIERLITIRNIFQSIIKEKEEKGEVSAENEHLYLKCPYCGNNMMNRSPENVKKVIRMVGLSSESVGPGGRELIFKDGKKIQLSDMCGVCDENKIWKFVKENYPDIYEKVT